MNARKVIAALASGLLGAACIATPGFLRAQTPPGPLPPAQPQTSPPTQTKEQAPQPSQKKESLSGSWKLNREESDDPRKKMQEARGGNGGGGGRGPSGGGRPTGGGIPFPFPGGGSRRGPYGGAGGGAGGGPGEGDRQQMQELFTPANSLTITQKDGEVDLTDDQNRKRAFYTDGRKVQKSKDDSYREVAAHWEGNRLVSEDKGPRGGTLRRSFEVAPGGEQLYEKLQLTDPRSGSLVVIRYVYDSIPETKQ